MMAPCKQTCELFLGEGCSLSERANRDGSEAEEFNLPDPSVSALPPSLSLLDSEGKADYRKWLIGVLSQRKRHNPSYSLRALAGSLGISAASLCQVISGKRPLTEKMALKISGRLGLSPLEKDQLLEAIRGGEGDTKSEIDARQWLEIRDDVFEAVSEWYHLAILSLADLPNNRGTPYWISGRLGISVETAREALSRLQRLGVLKQSHGKLAQISKPLSAGGKIPNAAIRKYHLQILKKAARSLDEVPFDDRHTSAITMAIDVRNLPRAEAIISDFRRKLCKMLETGKKERVYTLSIQLFPVDRGEER